MFIYAELLPLLALFHSCIILRFTPHAYYLRHCTPASIYAAIAAELMPCRQAAAATPR